jgi:transcriptional regulator with XRE-family HTH domain
MNDMINLRGLALSKFRNISDFANAIGWSRNKASRILNGNQIPNGEEIESLAICLDVSSADAFIQIFFAPLSTKWTSDRESA